MNDEVKDRNSEPLLIYSSSETVIIIIIVCVKRITIFISTVRILYIPLSFQVTKTSIRTFRYIYIYIRVYTC